jgi:hypothetical protein
MGKNKRRECLWISSEVNSMGRGEVSFVGHSFLSLFFESELDSPGGEEGDVGFLALSNDETVGSSGGESLSVWVLDVADVERTGVLFNVLDDTDSTDVVTSDGDNLGSVLVLDDSFDFIGLKVEL